MDYHKDNGFVVSALLKNCSEVGKSLLLLIFTQPLDILSKIFGHFFVRALPILHSEGNGTLPR